MNFDIKLLSDANALEIENENNIKINDSIVISNPNGDYDNEYTRNFIRCPLGLNINEFKIAYLYGDYHHIDDNRFKSGNWVSVVFVAKILYMRDTGYISEEEKMQIESGLLQLLPLLGGGHFKTTYQLGMMIKQSMTSKLADIIDSFLLIVNEYIEEYY